MFIEKKLKWRLLGFTVLCTKQDQRSKKAGEN